MRKAFQNAYFVGIMAVVGAAAVAIQLHNALSKQSGHPRARDPQKPETRAQVAADAPATSRPELAVEIAQIPWGIKLDRDPFQAVRKPAPSPSAAAGIPQTQQTPVRVPPPKLSAVSIQQSSRLAILNGRVVGEGDVLQDWKVQAIYPDRVVLDGPRGQANVRFSSVQQ